MPQQVLYEIGKCLIFCLEMACFSVFCGVKFNILLQQKSVEITD